MKATRGYEPLGHEQKMRRRIARQRGEKLERRDDPTDEASKKRRKLGRRYRDQLEGLLTEEQLEEVERGRRDRD
jgi:hypothetical protein